MLFRQEAIEAQRSSRLGDVILVRPLSLTLLTALAVLFALGVFAFLVIGSYTKRSTVTGYLVPNSGVLKIYTPQIGIVVESYAREGEDVAAGQTLLVISSERQTGALASQANISALLEQRGNSLREEIEETRHLHERERSGLEIRLQALEQESQRVAAQIVLQRQRLALAEEAVTRYDGLLRQDYVSREQLQQKQEKRLDQQARLQELERSRYALAHDSANLQSELAQLPLPSKSRSPSCSARLPRTSAT